MKISLNKNPKSNNLPDLIRFTNNKGQAFVGKKKNSASRRISPTRLA